MKDLLAVINETPGKLKIELSSDDLLIFSNQLINRAKKELSQEIADARKERYLTKQEVKDLCGVCDSTLWHWDRRNYLKKLKIGNKVKYRYSDVRKIIEGK